MELISKLTGNRSLSAIFLFLVSFALFSPSLKNDFVWDDVEVITKGTVSFETSNIVDVIVPDVSPDKKARYYRPFLYASLVADKGLWGISPFGFHLSNIIFHSVSVVLFYFMALLVLGEFGFKWEEGAAFLSSLLFALHPMHVESVSWVAGRTDVLCALFLFLAFISHVLSLRSLWFLVLTAFSFSLALFSKEVAVVFPALTLVFDLLNRRCFNRGNLIRYPIYLAVLLVYLYLRGRAFVYIPDVTKQIMVEGSGQSAVGEGHLLRILPYLELIKIVLGSYYIYISKLIIPLGFNAFITNVPKEIYFVLSSAVILSASAVLSFISVRKNENVTAFGILWILISLIPSVLVAVFSVASTPAAERYLYIPSAGFCLLAGYWIVKAARGARLRRFATALGVVLIVVYAATAYQRQGVWESDLALWRDTSLKSPDHPLPHANYGLALSNIGEKKEAVREFEMALSPEMNDSPRGKAVTANNLGLVYLEAEDYQRAEGWFLRAREYDPGYGRTYYHLGLVYFIKGELSNSLEDYREAEKFLRKTLDRYYSYGRANLLLAKIYMRTGERKKALEEARAAIASGLPEPLLTEARDILKIDHGGGD